MAMDQSRTNNEKPTIGSSGNLADNERMASNTKRPYSAAHSDPSPKRRMSSLGSPGGNGSAGLSSPAQGSATLQQPVSPQRLAEWDGSLRSTLQRQSDSNALLQQLSTSIQAAGLRQTLGVDIGGPATDPSQLSILSSLMQNERNQWPLADSQSRDTGLIAQLLQRTMNQSRVDEDTLRLQYLQGIERERMALQRVQLAEQTRMASLRNEILIRQQQGHQQLSAQHAMQLSALAQVNLSRFPRELGGSANSSVYSESNVAVGDLESSARIAAAASLSGSENATKLLHTDDLSEYRPKPNEGCKTLELETDEEQLSDYQIFVRRQLEVFEAKPDDVQSNKQGRKKQVTLGQVGLRCLHCAGLPLRQRGRGAVYYPKKLSGIYQASQNQASSHLCEACPSIPDNVKKMLRELRDRRETAGGGKQYWAEGAASLGVYEASDVLRMRK